MADDKPKPKGEMVKIESKESTYIQKLHKGQAPKVTGRDDKGDKR